MWYYGATCKFSSNSVVKFTFGTYFLLCATQTWQLFTLMITESQGNECIHYCLKFGYDGNPTRQE